MFVLRIPVPTHSGMPLAQSPIFRDLSDYIHDRLVAERIITRWDRAVHRAGACVVVRSAAPLPHEIVEWCIAAANEFYAPLHLGPAVQEEATEAARAMAAGTAAAGGSPQQTSLVA